MLTSPCSQHSWSSCCPCTLWKASLSLQTKALSYSEETWWRAGHFPQPSLQSPFLLNALGGLIISSETNAYIFLKKSEGPLATSCCNPKVFLQTMLKGRCISSEKKNLSCFKETGGPAGGSHQPSISELLRQLRPSYASSLLPKKKLTFFLQELMRPAGCSAQQALLPRDVFRCLVISSEQMPIFI